MQSGIDKAVLEFRSKTEHGDWYTLTIEGATATYCGRCGKKQTELRTPEGEYLPCKGFIE